MSLPQKPLANPHQTPPNASTVRLDALAQQELLDQLRESLDEAGTQTAAQADELAVMLRAGSTLSRAVTTPGTDVAALGVQVMQHAGMREAAVTLEPTKRQDVATVQMNVEGVNLGTLEARGVTESALQPWADWLASWLKLEREFVQLREATLHDELTGAWNRRFLKPFLEKQITLARERGGQVTVLAFDIDDFKHFNDRYGHALGDEVLQQTVHLLTAEIRETDVVARVGGDEFVVVFWDARKLDPDARHPSDLLAVTKRFREALRQQRFTRLTGDLPEKLTISGGLAAFPEDADNAEDLLRHADLAAMESKNEGKNAITFGSK